LDAAIGNVSWPALKTTLGLAIGCIRPSSPFCNGKIFGFPPVGSDDISDAPTCFDARPPWAMECTGSGLLNALLPAEKSFAERERGAPDPVAGNPRGAGQ
jgi:hypothetical protein